MEISSRASSQNKFKLWTCDVLSFAEYTTLLSEVVSHTCANPKWLNMFSLWMNDTTRGGVCLFIKLLISSSTDLHFNREQIKIVRYTCILWKYWDFIKHSFIRMSSIFCRQPVRVQRPFIIILFSSIYRLQNIIMIHFNQKKALVKNKYVIVSEMGN